MKITQSAIQSEGSSQAWQSNSVSTSVSASISSPAQGTAADTTSATISTAGLAALQADLNSSSMLSKTSVSQADGSTQTITTASTTEEASITELSATSTTSTGGTSTGSTLASVSSWQSSSVSSSSNTVTNPRLLLLLAILEALTKHRVHLYNGSTQLQTPASSIPSTGATSAQSVSTPTWAIHIASSQVHEEGQTASYQSSGKVTTADGRQISFSLDLNMQRYERQESTATFDMGSAPQMKDPLVLNLATDRVRLQTDTFSFDLNADGTSENISKLGSGSAFLALDRNHNGKIDNGSELFGATSGDGFADLSKLDDDHNGWIDENDAAFSQLQVWRPGEQTQSLKDAGVGAIALNHSVTPFTLKAGGETTGAIRSTGMFLTENGEAKTMQQIDMAV